MRIIQKNKVSKINDFFVFTDFFTLRFAVCAAIPDLGTATVSKIWPNPNI